MTEPQLSSDRANRAAIGYQLNQAKKDLTERRMDITYYMLSGGRN
jgi:hypothetical protein